MTSLPLFISSQLPPSISPTSDVGMPGTPVDTASLNIVAPSESIEDSDLLSQEDPLSDETIVKSDLDDATFPLQKVDWLTTCLVPPPEYDDSA